MAIYDLASPSDTLLFRYRMMYQDTASLPSPEKIELGAVGPRRLLRELQLWSIDPQSSPHLPDHSSDIPLLVDIPKVSIATLLGSRNS
jgi:hypothetical protein